MNGTVGALKYIIGKSLSQHYNIRVQRFIMYWYTV